MVTWNSSVFLNLKMLPQYLSVVLPLKLLAFYLSLIDCPKCSFFLEGRLKICSIDHPSVSPDNRVLLRVLSETLLQFFPFR